VGLPTAAAAALLAFTVEEESLPVPTLLKDCAGEAQPSENESPASEMLTDAEFESWG
jgi:hypothetical protein